MTLIEIPDREAALLRVRAAAQGLGLQAWLSKLAHEAEQTRPKPRKSAYGMLAQYGPGPSAGEIDENRRDMFRGFGEEIQ